MRRSPAAMRPATSPATAIWRSWRLPLLPCETSIITCALSPAAARTPQLAPTLASS